jgi:hypothetical protein
VIKGSQYGKYEDGEEEALDKATEFFQSKFLKPSSTSQLPLAQHRHVNLPRLFRNNSVQLTAWPNWFFLVVTMRSGVSGNCPAKPPPDEDRGRQEEGNGMVYLPILPSQTIILKNYNILSLLKIFLSIKDPDLHILLFI